MTRPSSPSSPPSNGSFDAPYNRVVDAAADVAMTLVFAYLALHGVLSATQFIAAVALVSLPPQLLIRIAKVIDTRHSRAAAALMAVGGAAYATKVAVALLAGASLVYSACSGSVRATFEYRPRQALTTDAG